MIIRKMIKNKWLMFSLLLGMMISVALVSTMPIYSEAILSRMLVKDLEQMQQDRGVYPGSFYAKISFGQESTEQRKQVLAEVDRFMANEGSKGYTLPIIETVVQRNTRSMEAVPEVGTEADMKKKRSLHFTSLTDLQDHIKLTDGRMPKGEAADGVYEVLVTDGALRNMNTVLNTVFTAKDSKGNALLRFKPVGVFEKKQNDDPYFYDVSLSGFSSAMVIDSALMDRDFRDLAKVQVSNSNWYTVMDYSHMELRQVDDFLAANKLDQNYIKSKAGTYQSDFKTPALTTLETYLARAKHLKTLMWSLNVPVLIMLGFYMFMVANLIAERQKNEIAVLRSRGAARWQIMAAFSVEGLLLSAIAWALGPPIGLLLTAVLGASNGFLSFVSRAALPVHLTAASYEYGAIAAAVALIMLLTPVFLATRTTIVGHKQQLARQQRTPLWHKLYLDLVAVAIAVYGLYTFRTRLDNLKSLGLGNTDLNIDPLQFIVPALFTVGAGLLLLRLYPYALRLIYWLGRKWWRPSMYATLIQVGRSSSQYQFLMVFLILTIATGVFSASAARTINSNTEDRIRYGNGADMTMTAQWINDKPPPAMPGGPPQAQAAVTSNQPVHYLEPAFEPFQTLPGVEHAAKVFVKENASFSAGDNSGSALLMGIDTDDFGQTAWFRDGLLGYPLNDYLNLMASDTRAVLISRTLAKQKNVKEGDTIWIGWQDASSQPFVVYGIVDYFPTFNPNPPIGSIDASDEETKNNAPMLIVAHLSRIQLQLALEPYEVWYKMKPGYSVADFYQAIEDRHLPVLSLLNTQEDLNNAKNDPFLMALNGILTLGFLISIAVSFVGFLLYWILSLRGRTLQNGIMRAIGLSVRSMFGMLVAEQLLTSGVAVLIGIVVGNLASSLFVPNFQIAFNPGTLVPPFKVIFDSLDYARLYSVVGIMLVIGLVVLGFMVARTRIHQALKLGED
jgi:putative ABC transport system permease protein